MDRLLGKVAIVTGGAFGIGRACCERMAEEGASIAILDSHAEAGEALADYLTAIGAKAQFFLTDLGKETSVETSIKAAADRFGYFDILVAHSAMADASHDLKEGALLACKHGATQLSKGGAIVHLSLLAHEGPAVREAIKAMPNKTIRINSIRMGNIGTTTDRTDIALKGEPDDIAWAVVYLASDEAKFVNGAELIVDGGYPHQ